MSASSHPSRREAIAASIVAASGALVGGKTWAAEAATPAAPGKPLRVAHLTDMHVQPERRAGEGYAAALQSLKQHDPAFIITGGDHVMEASSEPRERAKLQYDLYDRVLAQNTKLKTYPVVGNHDVWGWGLKDAPASDVEYGKAMALDRLKLASPYYSFDAGGWHFVILDSIFAHVPEGPGERIYLGQLGDEQTEWLKADLARTGTKTPVAVFSHIPILAVCMFFDNNRRVKGQRAHVVQDYAMHADARDIVEFTMPYNVKLLVSGHIHMVDRIEYRARTFICDGSVSGNWWKGARLSFPEGYGLFDLYPDGRFDHQYVTYGWHAIKNA